MTVAIVSLLASISFPLAELAARRERERELREDLRLLRTAIDRYKQAVDEGRVQQDARGTGYPPDLATLVEGVADAKSPAGGKKIYFLRRIPRDPMTTDPQMAAEATWGTRSYASPPDNPTAGADVFDVYSRSGGIGLNGVPYSSW